MKGVLHVTPAKSSPYWVGGAAIASPCNDRSNRGYCLSGHPIILHFDGGCRGNPGMCYGSFSAVIPNRKTVERNRIWFGQGTNNMAEYWALIAALKEIIASGVSGTEEIQVWSDSTLLVNQLLGKWRCHANHIRKLKDEALLLLNGFSSWNIEWNSRSVNVAKFGH